MVAEPGADGEPPACTACGSPILWLDPSYACDLGCTYCPDCADDGQAPCRNCGGQLHPVAARARPPPGAR